jgi:hypothetical protein
MTDVTETTSEWKWDVNHDGPVYHWTYNRNRKKTEETSPISGKSVNQQSKKMTEHWYVIHDGVVVPWLYEP